MIAAVAALTSVGHPHTETAVETTAPIVTDAIEDTTTTNATTTDLGTRVLVAMPGDTISTPAAENRQDAAASTVEVGDGGRSQPDDPIVDSAPQTSPATTLARPRLSAPRRPRRR